MPTPQAARRMATSGSLALLSPSPALSSSSLEEEIVGSFEAPGRPSRALIGDSLARTGRERPEDGNERGFRGAGIRLEPGLSLGDSGKGELSRRRNRVVVVVIAGRGATAAKQADVEPQASPQLSLSYSNNLA